MITFKQYIQLVEEGRLGKAIATGAMAAGSLFGGDWDEKSAIHQQSPHYGDVNAGVVAEPTSEWLDREDVRAIVNKSPYKDLLNAMLHQESDWKMYPKDGDQGRAVGPMQMWKIMVDEFNQFTGKNATHEDARDPVKATKMAEALIGHFAKHVQRVAGRSPTQQDIARMWNRGRSAWVGNPDISEDNEAKLQRYWSEFKEHL